MASPANTITTTGRFPEPPDRIIAYLQSPTNVLELNPYGMRHTQISTDPLTYSITFNLPILFGLLSIPVTTKATFEIMDDGIFAVMEMGAAKTSSRWTVAADSGEGQGGSVLVEEFKLLDCWWGLGWFILHFAKGEHKELFKILGQRLNEG